MIQLLEATESMRGDRDSTTGMDTKLWTLFTYFVRPKNPESLIGWLEATESMQMTSGLKDVDVFQTLVMYFLSPQNPESLIEWVEANELMQMR